MAKQYVCLKDTFWSGAFHPEGDLIVSDKDLSKFKTTFKCITETKAPVSKKEVAKPSTEGEVAES